MQYETGKRPEKERVFFGDFFDLCTVPFEEDFGAVLKQAGEVYERNQFAFAKECITAFLTGFVNGEKQVHEKGFLTELWRILVDYYYPEDSDDFWSEVIDTSCALGERYKGDFARKCVVALLDELARRYKASKIS